FRASAAHRCGLRTALLEPPGAELGERAGEFLRAHFESASLEPHPPFQSGHELARLGFRSRWQHLADSPAVSADVHGAPTVAVSFDGGHQVLSLRSDPGIVERISPRAYDIKSDGTNRTPHAIPFARGSSPRSTALYTQDVERRRNAAASWTVQRGPGCGSGDPSARAASKRGAEAVTAS